MAEDAVKTSKSKLLAWLVFSLAGLLGLSAILQDEGTSSPPVATLEAGGVRITGSVSRSTIQVGKTLVVWLSVSNLGQLGISDIQISDMLQRGLELISLRGCGHSSSVTPKTQVSPVPPQVPVVPFKCGLILQPGQTVTVRGELRGAQAWPRENVFALFEWKDAAGAPSQAAIGLGNIAVNDTSDWALAVARKSIELAKDLALPLVLVLLGWYFQQQESKRAEEALENRERRVQVAGTWSKMLPRSHELMINYYMHLAAAAHLAARGIESSRQLEGRKANEANGQNSKVIEEADRAAFYYVSIFERRVRYISHRIGGFHFKNRLGEMLASQCLREYRRLYPGEAEHLQGDVSVVTDCLKPFDSREKFLRKLDGKGGLKDETRVILERHFQYFRTWLKTDPSAQVVVCLRALVAVVEYEMNRPYLYWYDEPEKLRLTKETEDFLKRVAAKIQAEREIADFASRTHAWLTAGKAGAR